MIVKIIRCLVCGKEWPWVDEHSFKRCDCGNLYVMGFEREETELECEDLQEADNEQAKQAAARSNAQAIYGIASA